jgi:GntR family transcriptional regulator
MAEYGVRSRSQLDRALRELEADGLIDAIQGSGIYVRVRHLVRRDLVAGIRMEHERAIAGQRAGGLFELMTGTESNSLTVETDYDWTAATGRIPELLGVEPASELLVRTFKYAIEGVPHQIARSHLPAETARRAGLEGPESEQVGVGTIAQLIDAGIEIGRVQITLETRMPTASETRDLSIPRGTSVYEHTRVMFTTEEQPVEVSTAVVPGDRVAYVLDINLRDGR